MKRIVSGFLSTFALVLCLTPLGAVALGHHQSGIIGQTAYGRTCDPLGCVPNLVPMRLMIYSDRGRLVEDIISDEDGFFEIALNPGLYHIAPYFVTPSAEGELVPVGAPFSMLVEKKDYTFLTIFYVPLVQPTPPPTRPPSFPPTPPLPVPIGG
jgi:hypothetical protein